MKKIIICGILGFFIGIILTVPFAMLIIPQMPDEVLDIGLKIYDLLFGISKSEGNGMAIAGSAAIGILLILLFIFMIVFTIIGVFIGKIIETKIK